MKVKKKCKHCNKIFYIYPSEEKKGTIYCSRKCFLGFFDEYRRSLPRFKRICETCKKAFIVTSYQERKGKRKYCSIICLNNRTTPLFERICKGCKKHFWVTKKMESKGTRKYCSSKCMGLGWSMGQNPHIFKGEKVNRICKNCKKSFKILSSQIKKNTPGNFCSKGCRNTFYGLSIESKEKIRQSRLKQWQDKEYKDKQIKIMLKGLIIRPTTLEQQMINIIKKHNLPYKYTGNGDFIIGHKNPDFININGEKKYIEVGNTYHHKGDYIEKRTAHFRKYGWEGYYFIVNKLNEEEVLRTLKGHK